MSCIQRESVDTEPRLINSCYESQFLSSCFVQPSTCDRCRRNILGKTIASECENAYAAAPHTQSKCAPNVVEILLKVDECRRNTERWFRKFVATERFSARDLTTVLPPPIQNLAHSPLYFRIVTYSIVHQPLLQCRPELPYARLISSKRAQV